MAMLPLLLCLFQIIMRESQKRKRGKRSEKEEEKERNKKGRTFIENHYFHP
jgi:hypothetical protein